MAVRPARVGRSVRVAGSGAQGIGRRSQPCAWCGLDFAPAKEFHKLCWSCWHAERWDPRAPELMDELADMLPALVQLCHPDQHSNSEASTRVTQWLLDLRSRLVLRSGMNTATHKLLPEVETATGYKRSTIYRKEEGTFPASTWQRPSEVPP
jgi:hypothetical protein